GRGLVTRDVKQCTRAVAEPGDILKHVDPSFRCQGGLVNAVNDFIIGKHAASYFYRRMLDTPKIMGANGADGRQYLARKRTRHLTVRLPRRERATLPLSLSWRLRSDGRRPGIGEIDFSG